MPRYDLFAFALAAALSLVLVGAWVSSRFGPTNPPPASPPRESAEESERKAVAFVEKRGGRVRREVRQEDRDEEFLREIAETMGRRVEHDQPVRPVVGVSLYGTAVTDEELKELARFKALTSLSLSNCAQLTDAGLKELAPLTTLTHLDLEGTPVTDAGLKELAPLQRLECLILANTRVTAAGLKNLAPLKNLRELRELRLPGEKSQVTGQVLAALRAADLLHTLPGAVASEYSHRAARQEDVLRLDLRDQPVTDAGLKELAPLTRLTELTLTGTRVTDEGLKNLLPLTRLSRLTLRTKGVSGSGLKDLAPLRNLTTLILDNSSGGTTDRPSKLDLQGLAALEQLTTLSLSIDAIDGDEKELKHLAAVKNLTRLEIRCWRLTDAQFRELRPLKNLKRLWLSNTLITDAALKHVAAFENLTSLNLSSTEVTDAGVKHLTGLKGLTELTLCGTDVTDKGVEELAALTNLTKLDLRATGVTPDGVMRLQAALPKCVIDTSLPAPSCARVFE